MDIHTPIDQIAYVGETYAKKLQKLGIFSLKDLLYHLPFRYEDTSTIMRIGDLPHIQAPLYTVQGKITEIQNIYTRYGKKLTEAIIEDESGAAEILWFNQPYLTKALPLFTDVIISGKVSFEDIIRPKFISPSYEVVKATQSIHIGGLTAIYPETQGVSSKWLRTRINDVVKQVHLDEWLPSSIRKEFGLLELDQAIHEIHQPPDLSTAIDAKHRLAFDEMLLIQLLMQEKRNKQQHDSGLAITYPREVTKQYIASLPFALTNAQLGAIQEILEDLTKDTPMNRLLQGEVGSGKTVVAAAAMHHIVYAGYNVAMMAPTSILAKQHYDTLKGIFSNLGYDEESISLVTNKSKPNKEAKIFVGTQALLFQPEILRNLVLAVVDEQHRFGVHQREKMQNAQGEVIHSLTMTATPIPRSLALTIYGDLDLSLLDELPKERKPITTRIVPGAKREAMYDFVKKEIDAGRQAFVICPLVGLSDKLNVKSATEEFERLKKEVFNEYKLVLLHGQMKSGEKDDILQAFKDRKYDILVSTPVVEVGIDIPNASVMIIEGAERFGLAQLHQLRGRVGRGVYQSYCFLLTTQQDQEETERLAVFAKNQSGQTIAEFDLQNRGPGEVYGVRQSGIPILKAASLLDTELIIQTRDVAKDMLVKKLTESVLKKLDEFKQEIANLN
jgi:ATP-dependent DNA helicase RecG